MTTDELFAEMERLEAAATPGAVEAFDPNESVAPPHWHIANDSYSNPDDGPAYCAALECGTRDDALFDEFLRNHAPGLIRSLRQERDAAHQRETDAFDTIFYEVPQLCGEDGKKLSVADKIKILVELTAKIKAERDALKLNNAAYEDEVRTLREERDGLRDQRVKIDTIGANLLDPLGKFVRSTVEGGVPLTTTIVCECEDIEPKTVLYLWATTDEKEPPARIRELAASKAAAIARADAAESARDAAHAVLRELAGYVSAGGFNADAVDAATFKAKIVNGIDTMLRVEEKRREELEKRVTELGQRLTNIERRASARPIHVCEVDTFDLMCIARDARDAMKPETINPAPAGGSEK